jgi:hypothetical protein
MAVATSLDGNARDRLMLEILRHHRRRATQECEWAGKHAVVAHRDQLRHAIAIARGQNCDRIAGGRSE